MAPKRLFVAYQMGKVASVAIAETPFRAALEAASVTGYTRRFGYDYGRRDPPLTGSNRVA